MLSQVSSGLQRDVARAFGAAHMVTVILSLKAESALGAIILALRERSAGPIKVLLILKRPQDDPPGVK